MSRNLELKEYTKLSPGDLARYARMEKRPASLWELYDLFAAEYAYRAVERVPYQDFVIGYGKETSQQYAKEIGDLLSTRVAGK